MNIGLIGFGQFGQLATRHLAPHAGMVVTDAVDKRAEAEGLGVRWGTLADVCACEVVVLAVPVNFMRETLARMAPLLAEGAVVVDVGSVKMQPVQWMLELLPEQVGIVATHPLFGPQSAKHGLAGLKMAVCPVRGDFHLRIGTFCREVLGLNVLETTAEEHDREMAYVQALTHLIGRALVNMKIPAEEMQTQSYKNLLGLCDLIGQDTWELFHAVQTQNPFASEVTARFREEVNGLMAKVDMEKGS